MKVDVGQLKHRLAGFFERPLAGHSDIRQQMRIIREITEQLALFVPCPPEAPTTQFLA
jgi:hypothetical protein